MELGLGTVQFGLAYGISNKKGRTPEQEVQSVLTLAAQKGIKVLDTAASYGDAESLLGRYMPRNSSFRVVTKTVPLYEARGASDACRVLRKGFERSLERLSLHSVDGLLVHHTDDFFGPWGRDILSLLEDLRQERLIRKIGLSVYSGKQIDMALDCCDLDLIQVPANVLDQRLVKGGHLAKLKARGVEVHIRSVFLQGLLLMDPETVPSYFDSIRPLLRAWRQVLVENDFTPTQGALAYVRSLKEAEVILLGVENADQLAANIDDFVSAEGLHCDFERFALNNHYLLNPSYWKF